MLLLGIVCIRVVGFVFYALHELVSSVSVVEHVLDVMCSYFVGVGHHIGVGGNVVGVLFFCVGVNLGEVEFGGVPGVCAELTLLGVVTQVVFVLVADFSHDVSVADLDVGLQPLRPEVVRACLAQAFSHGVHFVRAQVGLRPGLDHAPRSRRFVSLGQGLLQVAIVVQRLRLVHTCIHIAIEFGADRLNRLRLPPQNFALLPQFFVTLQ